MMPSVVRRCSCDASPKVAKELQHIQGWLERGDEIAEQGKVAYLAEGILQEPGDTVRAESGGEVSAP